MAKINVIKQQDLKDCGACSLACIIDYYDGYVPLEKIREDTCTNLTGTTAYHLITCAESYGFDAMGVKAKSLDDENIYLPAIAHVVLNNGLNHFVVIYKINKNYVWLMDPARGKVKLSRNEFLAIWDNVLILMTPKGSIIHYDKKITIISLLLKLISKNKGIFTKICLINILLTFLTILGSFYFQVAISSVEKGHDTNLLKIIIVLFLIIFLFKVLISYIKNYYINYFHKNLDAELFVDFIKHIFNLPLKFMQNRTTGEIVSRVQELSEIKDLLSEFFTNILLNSILIIASIVALYIINDNLFLILCLIIIIYIIIGILFSKVIYKKVKESLEVATEFNSHLVENIEMNNSIKNLNLSNKFMNNLENKLILMLKCNFNLTNILNEIEFLKNFIYEIGLFIVMTFGIILVYKNNLDILSLVTFNSIMLYLFNPIKEIIDLIPKYNYIKASFNKITEFINIEIDNFNNGLKNIGNPLIEFKNVSYSYNKYKNVLTNVNFLIEPNKKVLITGNSGKGKSTICKLLYGYIREYKGIIKLNNTSEHDYSLEALRTNIVYINQTEKLFTGTIKENIICFRDIPESDFLDIVKICKLEDIVSNRPNRYNTMINASINNLSGGEKQRIILARGLLKKAKIIIIDEALSEVNLSLEKEIIDNIKEHFQKSTLIYISHKNVNDKFEKIINIGDINE
ncbi:MAG: peptidase domain-containing ABC transporter [Firmicutes bacterium]|nr:peptidase domain-containing ABC transporter [Bacillota bacterium]